MTIFAVTGHRPDKLGGYDFAKKALLEQFARQEIENLEVKKGDTFLTGMALGWDQAVARACVDLGIDFQAHIPFPEQYIKWSTEQKKDYHALMNEASLIVCYHTEYKQGVFQIRNEGMVNRCDILISLHDGSIGGTCNTVKYAQRAGKPIKNLWPYWQQFSK